MDEKGSGTSLEFAYRYPFSSEAKEIISKADNKIDDKFLKTGKLRIEEDLSSNPIFVSIGMNDIRYTYLLSYVYSRMLISAINNVYYTKKYVRAEAKRAGDALSSDSLQNVSRIAKELKLEMATSDSQFTFKLSDFLMLSPRTPEFSLVNQQLHDGKVSLSKERAVRIIEGAVASEISRNLPIRIKDLPKRIVEYSKTVKLPTQKVSAKQVKGSYNWIESVLANPISDIRHRTVNLILAPYLTNVKGLEENEAARIIIEYIEKCRALNPDTRVNETYIKYQCRYAKSKGLRPLSFDRAKELFKGVLELERVG